MTEHEWQEELEALEYALSVYHNPPKGTLAAVRVEALRRLLARLEVAPAEPTLRLSEALAVVGEAHNHLVCLVGSDMQLGRQQACNDIARRLTVLAGGAK